MATSPSRRSKVSMKQNNKKENNVSSKLMSCKSESSSGRGSDDGKGGLKKNQILCTSPPFRQVNVDIEPEIHPVTDLPEVKTLSAIKSRTETRSTSGTSCKTGDLPSMESFSKTDDPQPLLTMLEKKAAKKGKILKHTRTESPVDRWKRHKNHLTNVGFAIVAVTSIILVGGLALTTTYFLQRHDKQHQDVTDEMSSNYYSNDIEADFLNETIQPDKILTNSSQITKGSNDTTQPHKFSTNSIQITNDSIIPSTSKLQQENLTSLRRGLYY